MKFADYMIRAAIRVPLQARDKEGVIREMVQALVDAGEVGPNEQETVVRIALNREALCSSGLGRGVSVMGDTILPCLRAGRLLGTVAVSPQGVDFNSLDGEPTHLFFLLVLPRQHLGLATRAVENILRQLRNDTWLAALRKAKNPEEIWDLLEQADSNLGNP